MDTSLPPSQGLSFYEQGMPTGLNDPFSAFLGPPARPQSTNPYEKRNTAVFSMPENYLGQNLFLGDTIADYMFTAQQTHLTERVMPWFATDQLYVQWQQWENNAHFLDTTPHQSLSKRITQRRNIRRSSLIRRGIMFEFEHHFIRTALGQMSFIKGLGQIARSVQETANIEVIRALVNGHRYQQQYQRDHGVFRQGNLREALEWDRNRFGLVQKDQLGLEKWDAEVRAEMYAWRGQANAILMGEEISIYATFVGPERTLFKNAGERGPARVNNDPAYKQLAAAGTQGAVDRVEAEYLVRDVPVFLCKSYAVEGVGRQEQLTRVRAVGEYAVMFDECPSDVHYKSSTRDIAIFDESRDDFGVITMDMAIENCSIWDANGNVYARLVNPQQIYNTSMDMATTLEKRNLGMNFLARPNPNRESDIKYLPVEYIGDIAKEYFSEESLLKAAESLAAAVFRGDHEARNATEKVLAEVSRAAGQAGVDINVAGNEYYNSFAQRLQQLVGADGVFTNELANNLQGVLGTGALRARIVPDTEIAQGKDQPTPGWTGDKPTVGPAKYPAPIQSQINQAGQTLLQTLIVPLNKLGAEYERPAQMIAQDETMSHEARAHAIREHINLVVDQQVPGFHFKSRPAVTDWFDKRLSGFQAHVQKVQSQAQPVKASVSPLKAGEKRMHTIGEPLPEGWRYVNEYVQQNADQIAREARANAGYGYIRSNLFDMLHFADQRFADEERRMQAAQRGGAQGGAAYYAGREGAGRFERMGQMAFGEMGSDTDVVQNILDRHTTKSGDTVRRFNNLAERVKEIASSSGSALLQVCALAYLSAPFKKQTFKAFRRQDIRIPFGFILARPQATYRTRAIIKCQLDGGTGNVFFGHSEAKLGHDNARGLGLLHYTCYMGAVITKPKNLYVQHDVMMAGYLGGMDLRFWNPDTYRAFVKSNQRAPEASICCFIVPYEERDIPVVFDIAGKFFTEMASGLADQRQGSAPAFTTALMYNDVYGFHGAIDNTGVALGQPHNPRRKHINRIVWRGCQYGNNPVTGRFDKARHNQGHLGVTYPGCAQVRAGRNRYLDPKLVLAATGN